MSEYPSVAKSEWVDGITGKPATYSDNVPEFLRIKRPVGHDNYESRDHETPEELIEKGAKEWNAWVRANADRWLTREEEAEGVKFGLIKPNQSSDPFQQVRLNEGRMNVPPWTQRERINLRGFHFPGSLILENEAFSYIINLGDCVIAGDIWANDTTFQRSFYLQSATIMGETEFEHARFESGVYFKKTSFRGDCWFTGMRAAAALSMDKTIFLGEVAFNESIFEGVSDFKNSSFLESVYFSGAEFIGEATFSNARFAKEIQLAEAVFHKRVRFAGSHFERSVLLFGAVFKGVALFRDACFGGNAGFFNCMFDNVADFVGAEFSGGADFKSTHFRANADFDNACFRTARSSAVVAEHDARCSPVPDFRGAIFTLAPNLGLTHIDIPTDLRWAEASVERHAASKLRRLQELAAAGHHHLAEKRFFRGELLCRRGHEATTWSEITMINLFELFSGCGLSFRKPVLWLLGLIVACGMVYFSQIDWTFAEMNSDGESWFDLVSYSVLNSLPLVGYASDTYGVSVNVLFGGIENVPWLVKVTAFFQNIASAVLLFFALLAIRNYFKLG